MKEKKKKEGRQEETKVEKERNGTNQICFLAYPRLVLLSGWIQIPLGTILPNLKRQGSRVLSPLDKSQRQTHADNVLPWITFIRNRAWLVLPEA